MNGEHKKPVEAPSEETRSIDYVPSDSWFVIIHAPAWPLIMTNEDDSGDVRIALFNSFDEAYAAINGNAACRAYGAEAFQLENGDWVCPT